MRKQVSPRIGLAFCLYTRENILTILYSPVCLPVAVDSMHDSGSDEQPADAGPPTESGDDPKSAWHFLVCTREYILTILYASMFACLAARDVGAGMNHNESLFSVCLSLSRGKGEVSGSTNKIAWWNT